MNLLRHSIQIKTDIESAFQLCLNVENWPEFFPPCLKAVILKQENNQQLIEITAKTNDTVMTWQSLRTIDHLSHTIRFQQLKPAPLLSKMEGAWRFYPLHDSTLISLEHDFEVKDEVAGIIEDIKTKAEAVTYMKNAVNSNTQQELRSIKQILEKKSFAQNDISCRFHTEEIISQPAELVHAALWNIKNWPSLLPHCKDIKVLYEDNVYQEFIMQIMVQDKLESMRSIRCSPSKRKISYFQPEPPALLNLHRGEWILEPLGNQTRVISNHDICLNPEGIKQHWAGVSLDEALERIKTNIKNNSLKTIQAIADLADA